MTSILNNRTFSGGRQSANRVTWEADAEADLAVDAQQQLNGADLAKMLNVPTSTKTIMQRLHELKRRPRNAPHPAVELQEAPLLVELPQRTSSPLLDETLLLGEQLSERKKRKTNKRGRAKKRGKTARKSKR